MARGAKASKNLEEQIAVIDEKIKKHTSSIETLKTKRQELSDKQKRQNMKDLQDYMEKNNLSPDDILAKLKAE